MANPSHPSDISECLPLSDDQQKNVDTSIFDVKLAYVNNKSLPATIKIKSDASEKILSGADCPWTEKKFYLITPNEDCSLKRESPNKNTVCGSYDLDEINQIYYFHLEIYNDVIDGCKYNKIVFGWEDSISTKEGSFECSLSAGDK